MKKANVLPRLNINAIQKNMQRLSLWWRSWKFKRAEETRKRSELDMKNVSMPEEVLQHTYEMVAYTYLHSTKDSSHKMTYAFWEEQFKRAKTE